MSLTIQEMREGFDEVIVKYLPRTYNNGRMDILRLKYKKMHELWINKEIFCDDFENMADYDKAQTKEQKRYEKLLKMLDKTKV